MKILALIFAIGVKDKMNEEWRDIKGFEGAYQVSNLGRIKRIASSRRYSSEHIMSPHKVGNGYYSVSLTYKGKKKMLKIHRVVAEAFIPNPNNYPEINHKDENPLNNTVDNLEWCTHLYNSRYGTRGHRIGQSHNKPVVQCSLIGTFIRRWDSITDITKAYGYEQSNICKCLTGKYSQSYGYVWKYVK